MKLIATAIACSSAASPSTPETGDFSYRDCLARQGIFTYLAYPRIIPLEGRAGSPLLFAIFVLRDRAHQVIQALFPPPEAPLLDGILLGLDRGLPAEIVTAFRRTSTSHIFAISGFYITIVSCCSPFYSCECCRPAPSG